ncbi:MAG: GrpB family protein [Chloroflexota bacterium]
MIILINGPLGVGKTTVSWELLERFPHAVMLDGDYLGAVTPFDLHDPARVDYLYRTLAHLVAFHKANGYPVVIINYVFEQPESLAGLRARLNAIDDVTYAFRLVCRDEAEMERRIRGRAAAQPGEAHLAWELQRFRRLAAIQDAAALRGDLGFVIDTAGRSAAQAAQAIWDNLHEAVALAPYDPRWVELYAAERAHIAAALGPLAQDIQHIGSTAVPGLAAKPVIDILVALASLEQAGQCIAPLAELGYTFIDYPQNLDRRFFRKGSPRTHHLHLVALDGASCREHLAFRDALRRDPQLRQEYQALKESLAARYPNDRAAYSESKGAFVRRVVAGG